MRLLGLLLLSVSCFAQATKPGNQVFQYGHPLAQGMVAFVGMTEGSGVIDPQENTSGSHPTLTEAVQNIRINYVRPPAANPWLGGINGPVMNNNNTSAINNGQARIDFGATSGTGIDVPQMVLSTFTIGIRVKVNAFTLANAWLIGRITIAVANPFIRYGIQANGGAAQFAGYISTGGSGTLSSPALTGTLSTDTWYTLVFTGDRSGNIKMYQDGVLQNTVAVGSPAGTGTGRFVIGGNPENISAQECNCLVSVAAVWNRPLPQAEVGQWSYDPWIVVREPDTKMSLYWRGATNAVRPRSQTIRVQ